MSSKAFNVTLSTELIKEVDKIAKQDYTSRSDIIRRALLREIRISQDESNWETVSDFSSMPGGGIKIDDLITRLEKLDGQN